MVCGRTILDKKKSSMSSSVANDYGGMDSSIIASIKMYQSVYLISSVHYIKMYAYLVSSVHYIKMYQSVYLVSSVHYRCMVTDKYMRQF